MIKTFFVRPVRFVFHMRYDCPVCKAVENYVVKPLEVVGIAWFERVIATMDRGGINYSENKLIHGGREIKTPLIALYETGSPRIRVKYFSVPKSEDRLLGVALMAKSLIKEISRLRNIDENAIFDSHPALRELREVVGWSM